MDLETFNPMITERTQWLVKNKSDFFLKVLPLFHQLTRSDHNEILNQIVEDTIDYFEVAHYEVCIDKQPDAAPSSILVFDEGRIYYDILDLEKKDILIKKFSHLAGISAKFMNSRSITKNELLKRLDALSNLDDFDENDELLKKSASVPKDDFDALDRSAFCIIAKKPALDWIIETEKNEPNDVIQLGAMNWSLDKVNEEPSVFLLPSEIELLSKNEQIKIWKKAKKRAFEEFLSSFCSDEKLWPVNVNETLFDQWFSVKPMGIIYDIMDSP
jgi:hypothetical protein